MKFLGNDDKGGPRFYWCCKKAEEATDAISFLDDGGREYDSDRTGFFITGKCLTRGKHTIHKINFCPWCSSPVQN